MRHSIFTLGAMLAATFALSSCDDSVAIVEPASKGVPFEVSTLLTKTTNDGLSTSWASGDAINLFHAQPGATTYTSDGEFTVDEALTGIFSGTLAEALEDGKSYDWYANYPYYSYQKTPAGVSKDTGAYITVGGTSQTQTGNDSKAHLAGTACPLYGVVKSVAFDVKPAIAMKHLTSVVAVKVINTLEDELTVSSVSFTSDGDIVGTYYVDYSGDAPAYEGMGTSYVSETATLTVTDGTAIKQDASAMFYIAIKPHTAASGSTLKISVNGAEKTLTLPKDVTFTAGSIKTLAYEYNQEPVETKDDEITLSTTGIKEDSSTYTDWSGKKGSSSDAVYAGNSAGGNKSIQIRSKNSTSGIISTVSGGKVKKVSVTWNSKTSDGRTLNVYGSNTAYTSVSEFYSSTQGTLLGTIVKDTSTELVISDDYAYVGLRSAEGAMYLDKVTISWDASEVTKDPIIVVGDVTDVSARGVDAETLSYSITNPITGTAISATCDGTIVTEVVADSETILYTVSKNTSGAAREGKITLTYGSVTKDVKVAQLADTFKTSVEEVILDADADATKTLTVISDFDWNADSSDDTKFTISPGTYTSSGDGKQTVTVKAVSANTSEDGTVTLGTITFSNTETLATKVVTVKQKSSYVSGKTVTITFNKAQGSSSESITWTSDPITVVAAKGEGTNNPNEHEKNAELRLYSENTLTISGAIITKVEFTFATSKTLTPNVGKYDSSNNIWTGSTTTLVLTNKETAQAKIKSIVVTYE